jgi:membrane-bound metal-dependent hydrolase YbcI (DUF457 family)
MKFKYHIFIGLLASYSLVLFSRATFLEGTIIFLASILIDFDHYLWYGATTKDWNPFHAINWYLKKNPRWKNLSQKEKNKFKKGVFIFHSIGFWIALYFLSLFNKVFLLILIGIGIHILADYFHMIKNGEPIYNKVSALYTWKRNKNKKELIS